MFLACKHLGFSQGIFDDVFCKLNVDEVEKKSFSFWSNREFSQGVLAQRQIVSDYARNAVTGITYHIFWDNFFYIKKDVPKYR